MLSAPPGRMLDQLRRAVAKIDPVFPQEQKGGLRLGVPALDGMLPGGLAFGALHEFAPASPFQLGAAFGFAFVLAALAAADGRQVLCIETDFAALQGGAPYGPGLEQLGLSL